MALQPVDSNETIVKEPIIHFKNPNRNNMTKCGHDYTISGRTYSNVTTDINNVTCGTCISNINHTNNNVVRNRSFNKTSVMIIGDDTNDESKVPNIDDVFIVRKVKKIAAFLIIELEKTEK